MSESRSASRGLSLTGTLLAVFPVVFLLMSAQRPAAAQVLYGSIVGSVSDPSGAPVPSATVKVTQLETDETREAKTSDSGGFTLSTVHAGTYKVSVSKDGFKTYNQANVTVSLNTVVRVDASLQVGAQTQTVEVTAQAAPLQTDKVDVHVEFSSKQMIDLPQPTRSFEGIVALMPGIAPPGASSGGNNNPSKSFQVMADGASRSGTSVQIDGVGTANPWVQSNSTYAPSVEAIETVNVVTASSGADQGLTNGASINVQTKSGTNTLHGSAYGYNVNSGLKARPFFLNPSQGIPKLIESDLGGTVGGRIVKDKLFYFGSYEGDFIRQAGVNSNLTVPTAAIRSGNMSASANPIYDPASAAYGANGIPLIPRTPFSGNLIPASRINPSVAKLVSLLPDPNQNLGQAAPSGNYFVNTPLANTLHHIDTKFDWVTSHKWKLNSRYGRQLSNITQNSVFGPIVGGGPNFQQLGDVTAFSVGATYIATPTLVVDTYFGYTYAHQVMNPPSVDKKLGSDYLGIPGTNLGDLPHAGGMPVFSVGNGYSGYGYSYSPLQYDDPVFQYVANATKIAGKHNIRFGVNVSQQHMNHFETAPTNISFNGGATINFNGNPATGAGNTAPAANSFNNYSDFLLGLPQSVTNSLELTPQITLRTMEYSLYAQDTWNAGRRLTITAGTAWEYYPVPTRADRGIEAYNFATNQILLCGKGSNNSTCGISVSKLGFAPRIGIAYRPSQTFVIRAGYSLAPEQINMYRDGIYTYPTRLDFTQTGLSTYDPVANLTAGLPVQANPDVSSGAVTLPKGANFSQAALIPQNSKFVRGYVESENFTIQKDFGRGWIAQAGYVGTLTIHQHTRININYATLNGGATSQPFFSLGVTGSVTEIIPYETSHYNSLQAQLNHRYSHGFLFGLAYTRSKNIGTCCDDSGDGGPAMVNPQYWYLNRALMPSDRPNNLRVSAIYDLPFGKGQRFLANNRAASLVAGGWHVNTIISRYSGAVFSASGGASLNAAGFTQRATQLKQDVQYFGNEGPGQKYFDVTAFGPGTAGVIGNAGFNTLRGPRVSNIDISVFRDFHPVERLTLQFRAEALNATNTPHFSTPQGSVTSTAFGEISGVSAPSRLTDERYLRFGLKIKF